MTQLFDFLTSSATFFSLSQVFKTIDRFASKNFELFVVECHQVTTQRRKFKIPFSIRINLHPRLPALLFLTLVLLHHHVSIRFNSFRGSGRNLHVKPFYSDLHLYLDLFVTIPFYLSQPRHRLPSYRFRRMLRDEFCITMG